MLPNFYSMVMCVYSLYTLVLACMSTYTVREREEEGERERESERETILSLQDMTYSLA